MMDTDVGLTAKNEDEGKRDLRFVVVPFSYPVVFSHRASERNFSIFRHRFYEAKAKAALRRKGYSGEKG